MKKRILGLVILVLVLFCSACAGKKIVAARELPAAPALVEGATAEAQAPNAPANGSVTLPLPSAPTAAIKVVATASSASILASTVPLTIEFRFMNVKVNQFYATFYSEEAKRLQKFSARETVKLNLPNLKAGTYWINFGSEAGRWALDDGGGSTPNFGVQYRVGNGQWRELTSADAEHVKDSTGVPRWWNFKIVVK